MRANPKWRLYLRMMLLFCILYTLFHRILVITAIGPIQELVRLDHRNKVFVVVCDHAAALRSRLCVSHFETIFGVRVTLLNAFLLVEIIYTGLENSTRLNSSACARAYARAELYAGSMKGSTYARVYARIRAHEVWIQLYMHYFLIGDSLCSGSSAGSVILRWRLLFSFKLQNLYIDCK